MVIIATLVLFGLGTAFLAAIAHGAHGARDRWRLDEPVASAPLRRAV